MKKTVRSLLAVVMAVSMLLSMVIVSGLSVSAENEQRYYITADQITNSEGVNSAAAMGSYLTPSEDGKGWTMQAVSMASGAVYGSFVIAEASTIADLNYLVVEVGEGSTVNSYTITGWNDSIVDIYPSNPGAGVWYDGTFVSPKKNITCNLYELAGEGSGATFQIRLDTLAGGKLVIKSIYLTNVNPNPETAVNDNYVRISGMNPGLAGPDTVVTPLGDYGASFGAAGANNYAYYEIPRATVDANPYFYYRLASIPTGNIGWYAICGPGWTYNPQALEVSTELKVLDLRTTIAYQAGGSVLFQVWVGSQFDMDVAFLASTDDIELAPATRFVNVLDVYSDGITDAQMSVVNNVGVQFTGSHTYFAFQKAAMEATPYFVYKLAQPTGLTVAGIYGPTWWANPTTFPMTDNIHDDEVHVVDLREAAAYAAGDWICIMFAYGEVVTVDFDCFVLTNDPDFDYTQYMGGEEEEEEVVYYEVNFVTNGGSSVYTQVVPANGTVDLAETELAGYKYYWTTEDGEAYDFEAPVTSDLTLYAHWDIDGDMSPVFAQAQAGVTAESESAALRFVAAIDSLDYQEIGFVVSISNAEPTVGGENSTVISTNTVWKSILAAGAVVEAEDLHGEYVYGLTITDIDNANFDTEIYVRGYVLQNDGTYTYTNAKTYCVSDFIAE